MALRVATKAQNIASFGQGGTWTHGLGTTPDEYWLVAHGATQPYLIQASTPDSTYVYLTSTAGAVVSAFAVVSHSQIK